MCISQHSTQAEESAEPINLEVIWTATIQETLLVPPMRNPFDSLTMVEHIWHKLLESNPIKGGWKIPSHRIEGLQRHPAHPLFPPHQLAVPPFPQFLPFLSFICATLSVNGFYCDPVIIPLTQEPGASVFARQKRLRSKGKQPS